MTKRNYTIKGVIIIGLTILLLLPTVLINVLVRERQDRQEDAFKEISSKWAEAQTISGPFISIPYNEYYKDTLGVHKLIRYMHILPENLSIDGSISPEKRHRKIYETVVYNSELNISGNFSGLFDGDPSVQPENILYDQAFISVGITDLRGIEEKIVIKWNDDNFSFNSGVGTNDIINSGISAPVNLNRNDTSGKPVNFSFTLNLRGSQYIYFTPIGKETNVSIHSKWQTPSFDGAFLPDSEKLGQDGFTAFWKVLHLNRNYPQRWLNDAFTVDNSSFGINLLLPIDNYTKTDRSIKYAILFIGLTFLIFYFLEILNNKYIHPLQYILIGFALSIFYILLLSISEHMKFNLAYIIAAVMTIGLIWWYSRSILKDRKLSALVGGNLIILYTFIFTIIQLEDYSLLMGSLGLFAILALVMHFSKKIDWGELK